MIEPAAMQAFLCAEKLRKINFNETLTIFLKTRRIIKIFFKRCYGNPYTMLVPAMNRKEVTNEILKDLSKLQKSTINRLTDEYDRERRKYKIDKTRSYTKCYEIKTAAKNTWLLFFQKSPALDKYRNVYDAVGCGVVYYYSSNGLKAFRYYEGKYMEVYNGHFFSRYNERMQLNICRPVDIIKHFFQHSGYLQIEISKPKDGRQTTKGVCREGMALGEYYMGECPWLVHKTFINHELKRPHQQKTEDMLMLKLQLDILSKSLVPEQSTGQRFIPGSEVLAQIANR